MKHVIIANPRSGKGKGRKRLPLVEANLRSRSVPFETMTTTGPGDATAFATAACGAGCEVIVVLGGDGTLFEVVNGIMATERRPKVAQIPVGTGNSFIKDLGIDTFEQGLAALDRGVTRKVDLGKGSSTGHDFWFINLTGAGFVARAARTASFFKMFGDFSYTIAVLLELPGLKSRRLDIVADGVSTSRDAVFIEICNSRKTGGEMIMAPGAKVDDGLFDVVIAKAMNRRTLLSLLPTIFTGKHVGSPYVEIFTCRKIEARFDGAEPVTPDGELLGTTPLTTEVHPGAIEIFAL
ncbi:MAG: diacylglycerol kinase family lipid kinase [Spirochaetes bacterium]|nr:diacylglycerol kinase family lipid kinase [Spirochaetota bacterium]